MGKSNSKFLDKDELNVHAMNTAMVVWCTAIYVFHFPDKVLITFSQLEI